jgi:predicted dehydrogenase
MKITNTSPLVVFGAGSIGERHIHVLQSLGYTNLYVYRQRNLPMRDIDASSVKIFTNIDDIDSIKPVAAIIATPTALHLQQTLLCVNKGIHVLVEKPLSDNLQKLDELKQAIVSNNVFVQVGYMLRYHPAFIKIKSIIESKELGRLISYHTHWGEYLPHWHPWEDYRKSYAARKELGGGAALTLSHDIDIVNWLLDKYPINFKSMSQKSEDFNIDVEAVAQFITSYPAVITGHSYLTFSQKIPLRTYQFVFEEGIVHYNYFENQLTIQLPENKKVINYSDFKRNDMFSMQTEAFFKTINSKADYIDMSEKSIKDSEVVINMCSNLAC